MKDNNNSWIIIFMDGPEVAYKMVYGSWEQADEVGGNIAKSHEYSYRVEDWDDLSMVQQSNYYRRLREL